ncbi:MAG: glyoxylase family protein [Chloroflexota bacterium]|nr:glyoxylase family protein [Chloroflexota bacterium]
MTRYAHTNLVCRDWRALSRFYIEVFDCQPVPPERDLKGAWLDRATGLKNAHLTGQHLRLPGFGEHGPTLEIFQYDEMPPRPMPSVANRPGLGHLAFEVESVEDTLQDLLAHGGSKLGEVVKQEIAGVGVITFTYATDPEGNILEIQSWQYA